MTARDLSLARSSRSAPAPARRRAGAAPGDAGLDRLVHLLDSQFRIPGVGVRFGLDSIIGLIPGAGDLIGAGLGLAVLAQARREGASAATLARMVGNLLADLAIGAIPLVGDVADVFFKAHKRNYRLLLQDRARRAGRAGPRGSA